MIEEGRFECCEVVGYLDSLACIQIWSRFQFFFAFLGISCRRHRTAVVMQPQLVHSQKLGSGQYGTVLRVTIENAHGVPKLSALGGAEYACKIMRASQGRLESTLWHHSFVREVFAADGDDVGPKIHGLCMDTTNAAFYIFNDVFCMDAKRFLLFTGGKSWHVSLMRDWLRQLSRMHARGIAHRDLKLANLLVDTKLARGSLCDLGMTSGLWEPRSDMKELCTLTHRAPEILEGQLHDTAVDLYSFGVIAMQLVLCGRGLGGLDTMREEETDKVCATVVKLLANKLLSGPEYLREASEKIVGHAKTFTLGVWWMLTRLLRHIPSERICASDLLDSVLFRWDGIRLHERPKPAAVGATSPGPVVRTPIPVRLAAPLKHKPIYNSEQRQAIMIALHYGLRRLDEKRTVTGRVQKPRPFARFFRWMAIFDMFDRTTGAVIGPAADHLDVCLYLYELLSQNGHNTLRLKDIFFAMHNTQCAADHLKRLISTWFDVVDGLDGRLDSESTCAYLGRDVQDLVIRQQILLGLLRFPDGRRTRAEFVKETLEMVAKGKLASLPPALGDIVSYHCMV